MNGFAVRAAVAALAVLSAWATRASAAESATDEDSFQSMLEPESPEVFLAKATLQQYLSRVARKDWEGAKRLTHPKAMQALARLGKEGDKPALAPWSDAAVQLQSFRFLDTREVQAGVVLVATGEDHFRAEDQAVSSDDAAVYVLFRRNGSYLIADKRAGAQLADVTDEVVKSSYPGYGERSRTHGAQARNSPRHDHR